MPSPTDAGYRARDWLSIGAGVLTALAFVLFVQLQASGIHSSPRGLPAPSAAAGNRGPRSDGSTTGTPRAVGRDMAARLVNSNSPSATAESPAEPTTTPAPAGSPTSAGRQADAVRALSPQAPYFGFERPFGAANAVEASRYYPYGTDGRGDYLLHHGVDIGNAEGTPVLAIGGGEVIYAGDDFVQPWGPQPDFYGNLVVIRHSQTVDGQPLFSLYGHLSQTAVNAGDKVEPGAVIGLVGMAGVALGPHLHLEIRVAEPQNYESTRNAELFLVPLPDRGTLVGRVVDDTGRLLPTTRVTLFSTDGGEEVYSGETTTYPSQHVQPSSAFDENYLFADLPPGAYNLYAEGRPAATTVQLGAGDLLMVELRP